MKRSSTYLLGGIIGGISLLILVLINGGSSSQAGGAMIIGIFLGKVIGMAFGQENKDKQQ